jgi:hypothetical protein
MKKHSAFDSIGPVDTPPPWGDLAAFGACAAIGTAIAAAIIVAAWVMA